MISDPDFCSLSAQDENIPEGILPPMRRNSTTSVVRDPQKVSSKCGNTAMGCYDLLHVLGRGNFATVKQAVHVFSGEEVAVKIMDKTKLDDNGKSLLLQEVNCMRLLRHPNIVRLYEIIDTPSTLFLVLELADGGDLYDYMLKNEKAMSEKTARHYFNQIAGAVDFCHQLHFVHRDLKPENVLVFRKTRMVKLTDFGFGFYCRPGTRLETSCGSLRYSSPEILFGKKYDGPAVDVWGLGILLYVMVCGRPPFTEVSDSETISAIMDCRYVMPATISASCASLIARMLVRKPEDRFTLSEIRQHPWMQPGCTTLSPLSSDTLDCGSPGDTGVTYSTILQCSPLVARRDICDDAHEWILKSMVGGGAAESCDEVSYALVADEYNNITATYYLLAERILRNEVPKTYFEEEELIPASMHFSALANAETFDGRILNPAGCNRTRKCGTGRLRNVDLSFVTEMLEELDEEAEDDEPNSEPVEPAKAKAGLVSPRYSPSTSRRLSSTKSSPHLRMNKIREEANPDEAEEDDDFLDDAFFFKSFDSIRNRERSVTSPERLRRIDRCRRQRSRSGSGSSQTSSDTSDTEEAGATLPNVAARLPFTRPRHHQRHRSASSCATVVRPRTYSVESSENNSPTRSSAPVLLGLGSDRLLKDARKRLPVLQHSQSLITIPCHRATTSSKVPEGGDGHAAKKRLLHRPQSLPPVSHHILESGRSLQHLAQMSVSHSHSASSSPTVSSYFIRQQC